MDKSIKKNAAFLSFEFFHSACFSCHPHFVSRCFIVLFSHECRHGSGPCSALSSAVGCTQCHHETTMDSHSTRARGSCPVCHEAVDARRCGDPTQRRKNHIAR